ncbi:hypothetical protein AcV5_005225 [Taiwanofungus camphoratus]|nr:hypothetical protein AcV5_005225 [Antrodia cinnamomea]
MLRARCVERGSVMEAGEGGLDSAGRKPHGMQAENAAKSSGYRRKQAFNIQLLIRTHSKVRPGSRLPDGDRPAVSACGTACYGSPCAFRDRMFSSTSILSLPAGSLLHLPQYATILSMREEWTVSLACGPRLLLKTYYGSSDNVPNTARSPPNAIA